jgi:hypothetical protein
VTLSCAETVIKPKVIAMTDSSIFFIVSGIRGLKGLRVKGFEGLSV